MVGDTSARNFLIRIFETRFRPFVLTPAVGSPINVAPGYIRLHMEGCNMSLRLFLGVFLVASMAFPAFAQTPSGEISGVVTDSSGSVLPGVRVTLTNVATNAVRLTQTNESGVYVFPGGATRELHPEGRARRASRPPSDRTSRCRSAARTAFRSRSRSAS